MFFNDVFKRQYNFLIDKYMQYCIIYLLSPQRHVVIYIRNECHFIYD